MRIENLQYACIRPYSCAQILQGFFQTVNIVQTENICEKPFKNVCYCSCLSLPLGLYVERVKGGTTICSICGVHGFTGSQIRLYILAGAKVNS